MNLQARVWIIVALIASLIGPGAVSAAPPQFGNPATTIFINEIHYDNSGTDTGEAIEIAGPAGTDLTGWSIVLYNGSNGAVYDTDALSGVIPNQQGGYGTVVLTYPSNGIQNGAPDGIALVDASSAVVQFLSYEGVFTAVGGPADGTASTNIGVSETGSEPAGLSLQLTGSGTTYGDFAWSAAAASTFGAVNSGQSFGSGPDVAPSVSSVTPVDGATDVAITANLTVAFSEPVNVTGNWFSLVCLTSGSHTAAVSGGPTTFTLNPDDDFAHSETCTATIVAAQITDQDTNDPPDNMETDFSWSFTTDAPPPPVPNLVINEILADPSATAGDANGDGTINTSQDEFVEIVNNSGSDVDISGWALHDGVGLKHAFPPDTVIASGCSSVVFAGGTPTGAFGYSVVQIASTGSLGLNNTGDTVTLFNDAAIVVATYAYGSEGGDDQSLTRDPDITGLLVKHTTAAGSGGAAFSPGTRLDGARFAGCVRIHHIQGAAHLSPLNGQTVQNVPGIVTALRSNGFFMQDPNPDADDATAEGIFVFTSSAPSVAVGDSVLVNGTVAEFYPGGYASNNLATTEISGPTITVVSSGNALPAPIVIGSGGRVPPSAVIDDDATGDVETTGTFDAATDGIDFYESLEGMRVQINDAVAVGPTNGFGEIPVVGDNGATASLRTPRGGLAIQPGDFNPERIILDDVIAPTPIVNTGDTFAGSIVGVLDYGFGNFKLLVTTTPTAVSGGLTGETATAPAVDQLSVATFNVENLDANDPAARFDALADQIVTRLQSPDIIALEEVQDNNGPVNDAVVEAGLTAAALIAAIQDAGGPTYDYRDIAPLDDQDGGEPGGNIRVGFLFRTDRGLAFIDRPGGDATTATTVSLGSSGVELSISPGRIDPAHTAWLDSRKPLAGEFEFYGHTVIVIANHFNSKTGDGPLFGRVQPPVLASEAQRVQQAQVVNDFVDSALALDANANVIVLGDLNDFQFSTPVATLKGGVLHNLIDALPADEQYTYLFDGNSQVLDNLLVSDSLFDTADPQIDIVHNNAEFAPAYRHTDHDPVLARFRFAIDTTAPATTAQLDGVAGANGWYWSDVTVTLTASDSGSGVALTEYSLDGGATWLPYIDPLAFSTEGAITMLFRSIDHAGNQEADQSVEVKIDWTAPEASLAFDPALRRITLTGIDAVSGLDSMSPSSLSGGTFVYTVTDEAGHTLALTIADAQAVNAESASIAGLSYDGGATIVPAVNFLKAKWSGGPTLTKVTQSLRVKRIFWANAAWRNTINSTTITSQRIPDPVTVTTLPGLVSLQLFTDHGALDFAP